MQKSNFYVLTGGPGSGKTSVWQELERRGYICIPEVARPIIKEQISINGNALPWKNREKYSELMLQHSVRDFIQYQNENNICFFDRGIPDTYGYCLLTHQPVSDVLMNAVKSYRYNPQIFIFPFWKEIYETDSERKQDTREAEETFYQLKSAYESLGYQTCILPQIPVNQRTDFILEQVRHPFSF